MATKATQSPAPVDPHAALAAAASSAAEIHSKTAGKVATVKARLKEIDQQLEADAEQVRALAKKESQHDGFLARQREHVQQLAKALRSAQIAAGFAEDGEAAIVERAQAALTAAQAAHAAASAKLDEWTENAKTHVEVDNAERQEIAERRAQLETERAALADELPHLEAAATATYHEANRAEMEHLTVVQAELADRQRDAKRMALALDVEAGDVAARLSRARESLKVAGKLHVAAAAHPTASESDVDDALAELAQGWICFVDAVRKHMGHRGLLKYQGAILRALTPATYTASTLTAMFSGADTAIPGTGGLKPDEVIRWWRASAVTMAELPERERKSQASLAALPLNLSAESLKLRMDMRPAGVERDN